MVGWHHEGCFKEKPCDVCLKTFKPKSGSNRFCSEQCKGKWKYVSGQVTTASQYKLISGNWERYFSRLLGRGHRRDSLTRSDLLSVWKAQDGKCALSGVELTCQLEIGKKCHTNASIDRIIAGGPYVKDNIQLVCAVLNGFRRDTPLDDFIEWCRKVTEYHNDKS